LWDIDGTLLRSSRVKALKDLLACEPDALLLDLSDTEALMRTLSEL